MPDNSISLNKFISDTGYCSRREADRLADAEGGNAADLPQVTDNGTRVHWPERAGSGRRRR